MVDIVDVIRAECRDHLEGGEVVLNGTYGRLRAATLGVLTHDADGTAPGFDSALARRVPNLDMAIVVSNRRLLMLARSEVSSSLLGVVASYGLVEVADLHMARVAEAGRLGIVFVDGSSALFGTEEHGAESLAASFESVRTRP